MRAEHLRQWLIAATRDDSPDAINWLKVVAIVQKSFQDGTLAKECTCQIVVLIMKGRGKFRGIGIVKVLWKAIESLLNCQVMAPISFQDTIHRFRVGLGIKNANLKANLLQQPTAMREAFLFKVSLDLWNTYDAVDWEIAL